MKISREREKSGARSRFTYPAICECRCVVYNRRREIYENSSREEAARAISTHALLKNYLINSVERRQSEWERDEANCTNRPPNSRLLSLSLSHGEINFFILYNFFPHRLIPSKKKCFWKILFSFIDDSIITFLLMSNFLFSLTHSLRCPAVFLWNYLIIQFSIPFVLSLSSFAFTF